MSARTHQLIPNLTRRGSFILFEGCDRSGKTTQSKLLVKKLKSLNVNAKLMSFPDRETESGRLLDKYLSNSIEVCSNEYIHLLFALNRWEAFTKMKTLLEEGTTLVVDRYSYSGIAYSVAKGLKFDWCLNSEKGLLLPDHVFFLYVDAKTLATRKDFGQEIYDTEKFQKNVSDVFHSICRNENNWTLIDGSLSINFIDAIIGCKILGIVENTKYKPIKYIS